MVWQLPLNACVHVTHDTRILKMKRSMAHIKTCVMWKDKSKQKGKSKGSPMEAMCHTLGEMKSKSLDKVRASKPKNKENKQRKNEEGACGKEEGGRKFPTLIKWDQIWWGGRKNEG